MYRNHGIFHAPSKLSVSILIAYANINNQQSLTFFLSYLARKLVYVCDNSLFMWRKYSK